MTVTTTIPFSEACERNKDVILDILQDYFGKIDSVLEVGSGTGQHAIHFAKAAPHLRWQTSDQTHYLDGIRSQLEVAQVSNVAAPYEIDVNQDNWVPADTRFSAVYTANTFHIMAEPDVRAFFRGLPSVVHSSANNSSANNKGAYLFIYGPFKYGGEFTSDSNAAFDQSLRSRGVGSGIRDFEMIQTLAQEAAFSLVADHSMPANNQLLIWQTA